MSGYLGSMLTKKWASEQLNASTVVIVKEAFNRKKDVRSKVGRQK